MGPGSVLLAGVERLTRCLDDLGDGDVGIPKYLASTVDVDVDNEVGRVLVLGGGKGMRENEERE